MEEAFTVYESPIGKIILACQDNNLTGLWLGEPKMPEISNAYASYDHYPVFSETRQWLDIYFSGRQPDFTPALALAGSDFQKAVWRMLLDIPFGETREYGQLARLLVSRGSLLRASARCVGGAVGRNRISIIIPCHRVIGAGGNLTGFGGGLDKKRALLANEGHDLKKFFMPKGRG